MMRRAAAWVIALVFIACSTSQPTSNRSSSPTTARLLLFTRTRAFHHSSIPAAVEALRRLGLQHHVAVDSTDDPTPFTDANLARYRAIVFLLTTGDVLDASQQGAFERYIEHGGGYVGVHSASDTEYGWPWYGQLVGAFFSNHPQIQRATVIVKDRTLAATLPLPERWMRSDEWYNFRTDPSARVHVLLTVDEHTYNGGTMGAAHPIAWCHEFDGGRAWYTAMGHSSPAYSEPLFLAHILRGILYATSLDAATCSA